MSIECRITDYKKQHLNTNQWENETQGVPERDGKDQYLEKG
jgi:hypothetical protein